MSVRIVQLGSPRAPDEGLRIGTVRRPPRGVPKEEYAARDYYDVWLPNLAPTPELMAEAKAAQSEADWKRFAQHYRKQMSEPDASRVIDVLAALSHTANFSVGCYCEEERHCHRGTLKALLEERAAKLAKS